MLIPSSTVALLPPVLCRYLVQEAGVHHIDLNFGCPVRKVTSRGGGSALPLRPQLFRKLVAAAVAAAGPDVPVTVKLRMGLTPDLLTYKQVRYQ
jgi:tRNA-dihydrouridine synthase